MFSRLQRDSNPWPLCLSCSALPAELWRIIHWEPANLLSSSTREKNETQNEMNRELRNEYKSNEDETIAVVIAINYFLN